MHTAPSGKVAAHARDDMHVEAVARDVYPAVRNAAFCPQGVGEALRN
jgi:hypothetical protein